MQRFLSHIRRQRNNTLFLWKQSVGASGGGYGNGRSGRDELLRRRGLLDVARQVRVDGSDLEGVDSLKNLTFTLKNSR